MIHFCTELIDENVVAGWAFSEDGLPVEIEVRCNGTIVGKSFATIPRSDVGVAYPQHPCSYRSGFLVRVNEICEYSIVTIDAIALEGDSCTVIGEKQILPRDAQMQLMPIILSRPIDQSPFPKDVLSSILTIWPDAKGDNVIAEKICTLMNMNVDAFPFLIHYARFLRSVLAHFKFVERYFPRFNEKHGQTEIDIHCRANTWQEMLSIANHLYVLRSYGILGDFAEFGCFKGYSSAMLSFACSLIGIRMHIFDSFQGLPESQSQFYRKGDFSGGLEEVTRNVELFGSPSTVVYHRGYFSDSLPNTELPTLMAIWMDVDLETSARDVMMIAHKLDPRSPIFSHECFREDFTIDEHVIMPNRDPNRVIPPILDYFASVNAPIAGRFLFGNTGAFWRRDTGYPVVSNATLLRVAEMS